MNTPYDDQEMNVAYAQGVRDAREVIGVLVQDWGSPFNHLLAKDVNEYIEANFGRAMKIKIDMDNEVGVEVAV